MATDASRVARGWRLLGQLWLAVLLAVGAGAGVLAWLGPPEAVVAEADPDPAPPPPASAVVAETRGPPSVSSLGGPAAQPPGPAQAASPPEPSGPAGRPIATPDPALLEPGPHGALPRIGADGRTPMRHYARGFDRADQRPRLGLVLGGVGLHTGMAEEAIRRLPPSTAIAFDPYAPRLGPLLEQARGRGMESLVALPLEPTNYPLDSPGDRVLLTGLPAHENLDRLEWALARLQGYVGAIGALGPLRGERFSALPDRLGAVQDVLRNRGLLYVDARPGAAAPTRVAGRAIDVLVDEPATRAEIDTKLAVLERVARERGTALGYVGTVSPVLIERIVAWAPLVEGRGIALAPVSALVSVRARPPEPVPSRAATR